MTERLVNCAPVTTKPGWTDWHGCYEGGWGDLIVSEAYAHPAKYRPGLIARIYKHGFERGWWVKNDLIGDPFSGICGGGIYAAYNGLRYIGVELEPRFVELGKRNIELHRRRWENGGDPIPVMIQGDSREFAKLVACSAIVTSPPYAGTHVGGDLRVEVSKLGTGTDLCRDSSHNYANTPGQIGNLKAGKVDSVVTSPPYADSVSNHTPDDKDCERLDDVASAKLSKSDLAGRNYGSTERNIGNLKTPNAVFDAGRVPRTYKPVEIENHDDQNYWFAMKIVYEQCGLAIRPGGVLVVVVKDYVKGGKRVPLCDQTLALLESIGFVLVERIRAWVTKTMVHAGLFGDVRETKSHKSFFRRLAEAKGSPPIDWEEVICVRTGKR